MPTNPKHKPGIHREVTIEQMNRAICEFMGWEFKPDGEDWFKAYHDGKLRRADTGDGLNKIFLKGFTYHEDWNKLMPVGKKIYDLLAEMAKERPPHTACHGDVIEVDITCHIREYNIAGAHKSIYEFVQWFNSHKQK
jgi:hypothetical protein